MTVQGDRTRIIYPKKGGEARRYFSKREDRSGLGNILD
jgi:hypothetical protein